MRKIISKNIFFNKTAGVLIALMMVFSIFSIVGFANDNENDLSFSFDFKEPKLKSHILLESTKYTKLSMPGCMAIGRDVGAPSIPVRFMKILIPYGYKVSHIDSTAITKDVDISGFNLIDRPIVPYQNPLPLGDGELLQRILDFIESIKDFILFKLFNIGPLGNLIAFNESIYQSNNVYPNDIIENQGVHYCRGYSILSIALWILLEKIQIDNQMFPFW